MAQKFKLQSVLNYRNTLEEQAQQALALSQQQKQDLLTRIAQQQLELQQQDQLLRARQQEGLTIAEIDLYENRISHCRRCCVELKAQLQAVERNILKQREELLQAARERQVMEKLKERQDSEYRQEQKRKERSLLDEISLQTKGRTP